jgi:nitrile hydratase accessory protein
MSRSSFISLVGDPEKPFREGWEAQIFAIVVQLNRNGLFTWSEWTERLGEEIRRPNKEPSEFASWVSALLAILAEKHVLTEGEVALRQAVPAHRH